VGRGLRCLAGRADEPCVYLCGNSLGLLPKRTRRLVNEELDVWSHKCVRWLSDASGERGGGGEGKG
jgi:kynureninase